MRIVTFVCLLVVAVCFAPAAHSQSWNSSVSVGAVIVEWFHKDGSYTFVLRSPAQPEIRVIAWSLEPFNLPEPVSVNCPDGWTWKDAGGWKQFVISEKSQKYAAGGPGLEPGESLTFFYQTTEGAQIANQGGPADGSPAFLCHVGAVEEMASGKWRSFTTPHGQTWFDGASGIEMNLYVPEPGSLAAAAFGLFGFICFGRKAKRV